MTRKSILAKLEKKGYKVIFTIQGNVIAVKNNQRYTATSLNALNIQLFN
jgi:hypothetical protein